jgi:hypothetical protein
MSAQQASAGVTGTVAANYNNGTDKHTLAYSVENEDNATRDYVLQSTFDWGTPNGGIYIEDQLIAFAGDMDVLEEPLGGPVTPGYWCFNTYGHWWNPNLQTLVLFSDGSRCFTLV